ncbi:VWA containing CoxE family protein [Nodosilinea sp. AN01ver1]|uniref:VWA containing CoxE family protein n=1 Tax=Nodosilinea sp. AN01ver1 TaxID=3423362 RepID=UPI003D315B2E
MTDLDLASLVTNAFFRLRRRGFNLGISEHLAALAVVEEGFATSVDQVKTSLKLLWCESRSERSQFEPIWDDVLSEAIAVQSTPVGLADAPNSQPPPTSPTPPPALPNIQEDLSAPQLDGLDSLQAVPDMAAQPVRAPFTPAEVENPTDLSAYWPVSRRSMSYAWRYLRRPVAAGSATILDVDATVSAVARQGFYLAPVLQRGDRNQARLVLLIDQNGSMMPFHRFTRDLVETASGSGSLPADQVSVYYFHNIPTSFLYRDAFLTQPVDFNTVLANLDSDTSVLVVSDGGAARGHRRLDRIRATTGFLLKLRRTTNLIAWLNPMPRDRWKGSSADIMANIVPMFQMDDDGLSNAIDIVRGQPLQPLQAFRL